jgi:threonine synthase
VFDPANSAENALSLYIPTHIPSLPSDWQTAWSTLSFPDLSHAILSLFIPTDIIPSSDLKQIIDSSYSTFRSPQVTPLRQTGADEYVMELWHGPTWAFKDVALQFLGNLFAYFLERRNAKGAEEELTVVGATSGDTGR